jgi:GDP-L-fucose synthase
MLMAVVSFCTSRMGSKVYIAGHRGLIGSALLRALEEEGDHEVLAEPRAQLELTDAVGVRRFLERQRPDYVVLAAGRVGGILANRDYPADFITENVAIALNVIRASHEAGVRRLILFGSSCMYPREAPQPMAESLLFSGRPEETSMAYAVAKYAAVHLCLAYNQQHGGQRFVPVIPNSVYGPHDNFDPSTGHVLSALIARFHAAKAKGIEEVTLWGSGAARREFLYSDDLAQACLLLLAADLSGRELPMNVGPGVDASIRELAGAVARTVGYHGRIDWDKSKPDGAPSKLLDSGRMRHLGWRPEVPLEEGLRRTYDWYLESLK